MHIRNLYTASVASSRSETSSARSDGVRSSDEGRPKLRIVRDDVVISFRARARLEEMRQAPDVDTSIRSLMGSESLQDQRAVEVKERIQHGYYHQPGVLKEVAAVLGGALHAEP